MMLTGENKRHFILYETVTKFSFIVFLFFIFFGTSLPFQEVDSHIDETSNPVNQIVFSFILTLSLISLAEKKWQLIALIRMEKFLFLFLIWCFLSVIWSEYSFISFKRLVQIISTVTVSLAILLYTDSSKENLRYYEWILYPYLVLTLLAVLFIPAALDPNFMTWRGLTYTKNSLGQVGLVGIIISFAALHRKSFRKRLIATTMLAISILLLIGSQSMTSITTTILLIILGLLIFIVNNLFFSAPIGRFLITTIILGFLISFGSAVIWAPDLLSELPGYVGKDATFTGRTDLWLAIWEEIKQHPLQGCGFSGFWVFENYDLTVLKQELFWLPNQAHMGYLDILNETGLVGLSLVLIMIFKYFRNLSKIGTPHLWKWLVIATLIINFQETTLFRPRHLTGVLFIFAYLALYVDLMRFSYTPKPERDLSGDIS